MVLKLTESVTEDMLKQFRKLSQRIKKMSFEKFNKRLKGNVKKDYFSLELYLRPEYMLGQTFDINIELYQSSRESYESNIVADAFNVDHTEEKIESDSMSDIIEKIYSFVESWMYKNIRKDESIKHGEYDPVRESAKRTSSKRRMTESRKDDVDYAIGGLNRIYDLDDTTETKFERESAYNKYRLVLEKNSTGAVYPISGYVTISELQDIIDAIKTVKNKLG
jgi:hypothetical protein